MLVILSDEKQGLKALQTYKEITKPLSLLCCKLTSLPVKEYQTPMRMLIEHMPGKLLTSNHYIITKATHRPGIGSDISPHAPFLPNGVVKPEQDYFKWSGS